MPKCRYCKQKFEGFNSLDRFCSVEHAMAYLATPEGVEKHKKVKAKIQRERTKARKEALKTRGDWIKDLQAVFNEFIRLRDRDQPCISCDTTSEELSEKWKGGKWDAGHYRSRGSAPELRFHEDNVHKQCKRCNNQLSGNIVEYRKRLINRIGAERLEALEGPHSPLKLSISDIKAMLKDYRARNRDLKRQIEG